VLLAVQAHINKLLRNAVDRQWCRKHGKSLPPPKLPRVVLVRPLVSNVHQGLHVVLGSGTLQVHCNMAVLYVCPSAAESKQPYTTPVYTP
jgi:hypothetical protein